MELAPDSFTAIGCTVNETDPGRRFEVTLPSGTPRHVFMPSTYCWTMYIVGDYILTIGQQTGNRLRSLRMWSIQQFRDWLAAQMTEIEDMLRKRG